MLRPFLAASAVCLMAATPAAYADLSYSYVDGSVVINSVDTTVGEQDGTGVEGWFSYDVLSFLHVFGGTKYVEFDDIPVDSTLVAAGAGVHYSHSDHTSIYFNLAALTTKLDITTGGPSIGADDDGYGYAFGYREANKTGKMEFNLSAEHIELNDADSGDTWVNLGLMFRIAPRFKLTTAVQFAGDENAFKVGVRYYLPNRFANRETH
jgi:hypothetical protein